MDGDTIRYAGKVAEDGTVLVFTNTPSGQTTTWSKELGESCSDLNGDWTEDDSTIATVKIRQKDGCACTVSNSASWGKESFACTVGKQSLNIDFGIIDYEGSLDSNGTTMTFEKTTSTRKRIWTRQSAPRCESVSGKWGTVRISQAGCDITLTNKKDWGANVFRGTVNGTKLEIDFGIIAKAGVVMNHGKIIFKGDDGSPDTIWLRPAIPTVPTAAPTAVPTAVPTAAPTSAPTATPTAVPTAAPTAAPTAVPTTAPTATPTAAPTAVPTAVPTAGPIFF